VTIDLTGQRLADALAEPDAAAVPTRWRYPLKQPFIDAKARS